MPTYRMTDQELRRVLLIDAKRARGQANCERLTAALADFPDEDRARLEAHARAHDEAAAVYERHLAELEKPEERAGKCDACGGSGYEYGGQGNAACESCDGSGTR